MDPTRFDQMAKVFAVAASRRKVVLGLGAMALAGLFGLRRSGGELSAQTDGEPHFEFDPIFVSRDPIPLGDDTFLFDGNTFTIVPEVASLLEGTPSVSFLIGNETYFIDPSIALVSTPVAIGSPTPLSIGEAICPDAGPLFDVEFFPGDPEVSIDFVAANEPPVGCIRWNFDLRERFADPGNVNAKRYCSGTLISDDLFLTAAHCLDQCPQRSCERRPEQCPRPCPPPTVTERSWEVPKIPGTSHPISRAEIATHMHVEFNYQVDRITHLSEADMESFPVIELVEDQLGGLDYAILRLANTPGLKYGFAHIAPTDVSPGTTLVIMGHPEGNPKQVEFGWDWEFQGDNCHYSDLSTLPGESGGGILASPQEFLVGVHTNGGCDTFGNNYGVRIGRLLEVSPTLQDRAAMPAMATPGA